MTESEKRLLTAIRRIVHAVDIHSKQVEKTVGLTVPQLVVLSAIRALGEVTSTRVSAAVSLSQATVTMILDKLEAKGLVTRYRSALDRRIVHSRLTESGVAVLDAAPPFLHERFAARFANLDASRRAGILQALEEVADMMGAPSERLAPTLVSALPLEAPFGSRADVAHTSSSDA
jgi:DNA-binding MarR family transcriptional regulator